MMRQVLLARVQRRVTMAARGAAAETVLSREGLADAVALLARHRAPGIDLPALQACGMLFFHRALRQQGSPSGVRDSAAAGHLLAAVNVLAPDELPAPFRAMYRELGVDPHELFSTSTGFTTDPLVWWDLALEIMRGDPSSMEVPHLLLVADVLRLSRLSATPERPRYADIISMLGVHLCLLRSATGDAKVAAEAFEVCGIALELLPEDSSGRPLLLRNHGREGIVLATELDDVAAARAAVESCRAAARLPDADGSDGVNLGGALVECARLTGNEQLYREALETFRQVAHSSPEVRPMAVSNLRTLLALLLEEPGHRDTVAEFCRSALPEPGTETYADSPVMHAVWYLENTPAQSGHHPPDPAAMVDLTRRLLAVALDDAGRRDAALAASTALHQHAQLTHSAAEAREAITLARTALDLNARLEPSHEFIFRHTLASAYGVLYEVTGDAEAQREAVHQGRLAVDGLDDADDVQRATALAQHAGVLHRYAARMADGPRLHEALALQRKASDIPDLPDGLRITLLCGLAGMLTDLHVLERQETPDALHQAVAAAEQALSLAESGTGTSAHFARHELVHARRLLGEALRDPGLLSSVVTLADEILGADESAVVKGIAHSAELERARALGALARMDDDADNRRAALTGLARVAGSTEVRPWVRMQAAVAQLQLSDHSEPESLDRVATAAELLRLNVTSGALWDDRAHVVRTFAELTDEVVLTGLGSGRPARTLELLERCRGLLFQDLGAGFRLAPEHAGARAEIEELADRLRALDARDRAAQGGADERRELNREIVAERTELMRQWQRLEGLVPREDSPDVGLLAAEGPVVEVVSTSEGGYAFLVTGDRTEPVRVLPLPGLDTATAHNRVLTFLTAREYATEDRYPGRVRLLAQGEVRDTLDWLWQVAARPVLEALGFTATPQGTWPRLWWCPVGFLGHLPWHAAQPPEGDGVLDRVVSSYTTGLRSLHFARSIPPPGQGERALIVAQPEVASAEPLRGVEREIAAVRRFVPGSTLLEKAEATRAQVLEALQAHSMVHLACHAESNIHAPGRSRLLLVDHEESPLTLADLAGMRLTGRQLAVLSACSTFQIAPALADEALHITAAFQQAGFRHVVGAMWPVADDVATAVSDRFYDRLTGGGAHPPRTDDAAPALHDAVSSLRAQYRAAPTKWASFVHVGA